MEYYNVEWKKEYLETILEGKDSVKREVISFFNRLAPIETSKEKDCSSFTKEETIEVITSITLSTPEGIRRMLTCWGNYAEWCRIKGYIKNYFDFKSITSPEIKVHINSKVKFKVYTFDRLQDVLDQLFIDDMDKLYCNLLFAGFTVEEIINITNKDYDLEKGIITTTGGKIKCIDDYIKKLIIICEKQMSSPVTHYSPKSQDINIIYKPTEDNDYLIRFPISSSRGAENHDQDQKRYLIKQRMVRATSDPMFSAIRIFNSEFAIKSQEIAKKNNLNLIEEIATVNRLPEIVALKKQYNKEITSNFNLIALYRKYLY